MAYKWLADARRLRGTLGSAVTWALLAFALNQLIEFAVLMHMGKGMAELCQWDCKWYAGIVRDGYDFQPHGHGKEDAANWAFFPAFPLLAKVVTFSGVSPELALVLSSKVCFLLALCLFVRWVAVLDGTVSEPVAAMVLGLNPYVIYGNVGYTESMFLLFTCAYFLALQSERYLLAGGMGAMLGAVRFAGISTVPAYVAAVWRKFWPATPAGKQTMLIGLMLLPLGLAVFMWFLHERSGDALAFSHVQRAWGRVPQSPLMHLVAGFGGTPINKVRAGMVVLVLAALAWLLATRRFQLCAFSVVCTVLPLTTGLWAMPRYIWWQAPILFALVSLVSRRYLWVLYLPASLAAMLFMYVSWFSGKAFVV